LDRRSDRERFEGLYDSTYQDILAYCRRRVPAADAEDVVAATYTVAWRRLEQVLSAESPVAWLYRVAYRTIGNHRRGVRRLLALRTKLRAAPLPRTVSPADDAQRRDELDRVFDSLERLAPKDQELIRLASFEGLSHKEIALVVEKSPAAVRTQLYRARLRLRATLDSAGGREQEC
jgi:RNA polymerase sigma-70 factor, ECF subfamily